MKERVDILVEENLLVPGLIGPNESFVNVKGYLSYSNNHIQKSMIDLENKVTANIEKTSKKIASDMSGEISRTRGNINV